MVLWNKNRFECSNSNLFLFPEVSTNATHCYCIAIIDEEKLNFILEKMKILC
jgi:hypothetical protein